MTISTVLYTIFFSLVPISELRGAIPFAYFNSIPLLPAYLIAVSANALVAPIVFLFLSTIHTVLYKWKFYKNIFDSTVRRTRSKLEPKVKKFGYLGIMLFVAVPLPITGAYTGTLGAWILGLNWKKTCLAALGGVIISGCIICLLLIAGVGSHSVFIKMIQK
ncbi:MAG: small multi-drug export protein [Spirochaetales bacterium]|nr:small multi-drug export protein [Spirochaetales bacterium]